MIARARPRARPRIEDHHAEWLSLVETGGPFLTVPALKRALPDGLDAAPRCLPDLRVAYAEWRQDVPTSMRNVETAVPLALRVDGIAPPVDDWEAPERSAPVPSDADGRL
ncbi:MAG: hypothetical protein ACR2QA_00015 [Solirubrobacteraceae bacterium]